MFRSDLERRLKSIFGFSKVSFDAPSDAYEQDTLFIEIEQCKSNTSAKGIASAYVAGHFTTFSQVGKMPYGFYNKKIKEADAELTRAIFIFDADQNVLSSNARFQNVEERRTRFVFLYSAQYDPNQGSLTSLELEETA